MPHERVDCVVVGAGVIGLACARALAQAGREVIVLEAENAFGTVTSARNSEVIHAGIYYPTGSLRAQLCVRGKALLYDYCASHQVNHRRCGKLIVAQSDAEVAQLQLIEQRALANGVPDLQWLSADEAMALEPQLRCTRALLSPSTGIIDSHGLMLALLGDAQAAGAMLALQSPALGAAATAHGLELEVGGETATTLLADTVVNSAGHGAPLLAAATRGLGAGHVPPRYFAKGCYFTLSGAFAVLAPGIPGAGRVEPSGCAPDARPRRAGEIRTQLSLGRRPRPFDRRLGGRALLRRGAPLLAGAA